MKVLGVIPARLGSARLAEKILKPIAGRSMIEHVWQRANQARRLDAVIVACDDERILRHVEAFGGMACLTRSDHPNGTSRVAEVAAAENAHVIINIQGDEPLIHPEAIDSLVDVFFKEPCVRVATLAFRRQDEEGYRDPNTVKVVCDEAGHALYFSRSPLPYFRDGRGERGYLKHLGIYGYRRDFLLNFVNWPPSMLEEAERLEQLRILEHGEDIRVLETKYDSLSVDTAEDLKKAEKMLTRIIRDG